MVTSAPGTRRARRRRRERLPRSVPILAAVVAALLVLKGILALLGWPPSPAASGAADGPPAPPDWVTQALLPVNSFSRPGTPLEQVNGIAIHYVGNPGTSAQQNRDYFAGLAEQTAEPYTYASSHFLIGLDGEILQCVPLNEIAYCTSQRNADTISIECCHPDEEGAFTAETYQSLLRLTRWLMDQYGLDTSQVIRHYDATGKECPLYYVRHPEAWSQFLSDLEQA